MWQHFGSVYRSWRGLPYCPYCSSLDNHMWHQSKSYHAHTYAYACAYINMQTRAQTCAYISMTRFLCQQCHLYTCVYTLVNVHVYTHMWTHGDAHFYTCLITCTCTGLCTWLHTCLYIFPCRCLHTCPHTPPHTRPYTCTYMSAHMVTQVFYKHGCLCTWSVLECQQQSALQFVATAAMLQALQSCV